MVAGGRRDPADQRDRPGADRLVAQCVGERLGAFDVPRFGDGSDDFLKRLGMSLVVVDTVGDVFGALRFAAFGQGARDVR